MTPGIFESLILRESVTLSALRMRAQSQQRLIQLLLGKSIVEALLVGAVSVAFYLVVTNPSLRGSLDRADERAISGWAVDGSASASRVPLQLFLDGQFAASGRAAQFRPDVRVAGYAGDDWHGFEFKTPALAPGEHEARVYALHGTSGERQTLQLIGKPIRFRIKATR